MFTVNDMPPQIEPRSSSCSKRRKQRRSVMCFTRGSSIAGSRPASAPARRRDGDHAAASACGFDLAALCNEACAARRRRPHRPCGDTKYACWGGGLTLAMKLAGVKAGVIDGPATDLSEIQEFDLPMWSRGLSSITTRLLGIEGAMNVPISVGGQVVNPGDAVLADEQGVLVFAPPSRVKLRNEQLRCRTMRPPCTSGFAPAKSCQTSRAQPRSSKRR